MKQRYFFLLFFVVITARGFGQNTDIELYRDLYTNRNQSLDPAMDFISKTTYPIAAIVPAAQFIHGIANHQPLSIEKSLQSATTLIVTGLTAYALKYTIKRDRPYIKYTQYTPYEYDNSPTFPSGHVSFAFATATNLSIQYPDWYVIIPSYLYAVVVGYSRLHLGAHYPSDVLAGAVVGAGAAYLSYKGNQWLKHIWKKKTEQRFTD